MPAPEPASIASLTVRDRWLRPVIGAVRGLALLVVSVTLLPYLLVPVYSLQPARPFTGQTLVNPYAEAAGPWRRANFHAHSYAWRGMTSGKHTPDSVRRAYWAAGYDVAAISNYHRIEPNHDARASLPVYEHGFSIRKTHQLVLGARKVTHLDFPIWQTTHAKQYVLGRLHDPRTLTVVVHPYLRSGYGQSQLAKLSGYDLLEIRSHWNDATAWWDSVLTAGNAVYGLGNDDSHDVTDVGEMALVWTMVNAADLRDATILAALRRGAMYTVAASRGSTPAALRSMIVQGDTLVATFDRVMDSIRVIVDAGVVRTVATRTPRIRYAMTDADHYARIVATDSSSTLYLNPVIRSATDTVAPWGVPGTRRLAGIATRLSALVLWLCSVGIIFAAPLMRRLRSKDTSTPSVAVRVVSLLLAFATAPAPVSAQALAPVRSSPLPFRIGEYHEYDLKFGAITVGSGSLSVSGPDSVRGREVLRLKYEIRGGIPLFRVHDVMESWFDPVGMMSLRFTQDLNEGPKHYNRWFDFFPDELIVLERGKPRAATVAAPLDDAAFIYYVRSLKLEVGQTQSFHRYFRPNANPVTIQVLRRESITVPAGTFNTIVVKPIIRTSGIFSEGGQAELWFTDDSSHVLVQMKAKLSFGSLSLYLRPPRNKR